MSNPPIMQAGPLHAEALAVLHATSFPQAWTAAEFVSLLAQPGVAVWLSDHHGFIMVRAVADEAEILTIAVAPAERRKGIGAALLREAAQRVARGGGKNFFLEVAADNTGSAALYQKAGFVVTGRRPGYYAHGADALIMTLRLG